MRSLFGLKCLLILFVLFTVSSLYADSGAALKIIPHAVCAKHLFGDRWYGVFVYNNTGRPADVPISEENSVWPSVDVSLTGDKKLHDHRRNQPTRFIQGWQSRAFVVFFKEGEQITWTIVKKASKGASKKAGVLNTRKVFYFSHDIL